VYTPRPPGDRPWHARPVDIGDRKQELRNRMRRARASIPPPERLALARAVEEHVFFLPEVRAAHTVMLFYSFGSEVPTASMAERLLAEGRRLLLPFLTESGMEAAEVRPGGHLVVTGYGAKEPARRVAADPLEVDVVLTPGLAFDRRGRRLGYGGGHYDGYLRRLSARAARVGIGFANQLVDEVPAGPGDERVDIIVTDAGIVRRLLPG
jgi:5-formyltetrahydrofolate cyclo-ligase